MNVIKTKNKNQDESKHGEKVMAQPLGTVRKGRALYLLRDKMKMLRLSLWAVLAGSSFCASTNTERDLS